MSESPPQPESASGPTFFGELKRRKVFRVAGVYVVVAWLMLQAGEILFPAFEIPDWGLRMMAILALLGFPIAIVLAWAFEVTPDGVKVTKSVNVTVPPDQITPELGKKKLFAIFLLGAGLPTVGFLVLLGFLLLRTNPQPPGGEADMPEIRSSTAPGNSIAVLPFENLSADAENEYFARGVHEDILAQLAEVGNLKVISRTSVMQFEGGGNIPDIARTLGVNFIVEGSVRRAGNNVRVTAQLIDAATDRQLWAQTIDSTLDNVFMVQSQVAEEIVRELTGEIAPETLAIINRRPTENIAAYDLFLMGRDLNNNNIRTDKDTFTKAVSLLETAVELDPNFAEAWAELSKIHSSFVWFNLDDSTQRIAKAEKALEKARTYGPDLPETRVAEGIFFYHGKSNFGRALLIFDQALEESPSNPELLFYKAMILRRFGEMQDSIAVNRQAVELDPLNLTFLSNLSSSLNVIGKWEESRAILTRMQKLDPGNFVVQQELGFLDMELSGEPGILFDGPIAVPRSERMPWHYFSVANHAEYAGRLDDAIAYLKEAPDDFGQEGAVFFKDFQLGLLYRQSGLETLAESHFQEGIRKFEFMRETDPKVIPERLWLEIGAYIALERGDFEAAEASMKAMVALFPVEADYPRGLDALEKFAFFYLLANRPQQAIEVFNEYFNHRGTTKGIWVPIYKSSDYADAVQNPEFLAWAEQVRPAYVSNWLNE